MRSSSKGRQVRQQLQDLVAKQREHLALLLAHLAEIEHRGLHETLGYPTMLDFAIDHLHMDEEEAPERIEVARTARAFPLLFDAIADGRLHLAAVRLMAPYLTEDNAGEMVAAMTHRPESEIEELLAEWFPEAG